MTRLFHRYGIIAALIIWPAHSLGQPTKDQLSDPPDLADFRTLDKAITAKIIPPGNKEKGTGYLGIHVNQKEGDLVISEVLGNSPAGQAGLKSGDVLVKVNETALASPEALREFLQGKSPGEKISLRVLRQDQKLDIAVTLGATSRPLSPGSPSPVGGKTKGPVPVDLTLPPWKREVYRLAVLIVEFADLKHNEKITLKDWEEMLFSRNTFVNKTNATGQRVYGSLNDYFHEQSYGKFRIEGKVFAPVQVSKKRADYVQGSGTTNKTAVLAEALAKFEARKKPEEDLKNFDGLCFIYAGGRVLSNPGSVYYPHRGVLLQKNKRWPYMLCPEGGGKMENLSVFVLEFAKMLGLPHLAARPENPGSEGLGPWCLMSNGAGAEGKPLHLSAWCKEQLGWLNPTVIDPTTKQKLILQPIQISPRECLKVLVRLDGSEYFLLENRLARGFDGQLPGQGLLIWRIVGDRPILEESHGVTGPKGPLVHLSSVPYPSKSNTAFTPTTTPSSRSPNGGGLPVHLTNIRRLPDGRITLLVGYAFH